MEHDLLHRQIFDAIDDALVVIGERGEVRAANVAALRLFDAGGGIDIDLPALAELVGRRQKLQGVPLPDRAGRETGVVVDVDPSVGPAGHALLHFRAAADTGTRELWTDDAVATVAHEFRSPLTGMSSALHLLAGGDAGPLNGNQRRFIEAVQRGVLRLSRIVDGYLDLARVRAGVFAVDRAEHDVRALINGLTGDLALCHPALAARIDVDIEPRIANAFVDPDRLAQVVLNLVYNAGRFTREDGRVSLRVSPAGREALADPLRLLPFDLLGEPRLVCIEVEDEGLGMSPDVLAHVFDRYRADSRDPSAAGGLHLGLHISRLLAEAQDGWMSMDSRLGEGTTASVCLPADAATARMLSRLRAAEDVVQRLRAPHRPALVALMFDEMIREGARPASWPAEWVVEAARVTDECAPALVWVMRNGLALMVTTHVEALADAEQDHAEPGREPALTGACRVDDGMTFSGALRAAAAHLIDSRERRTVRAESGVEIARE